MAKGDEIARRRKEQQEREAAAAVQFEQDARVRDRRIIGRGKGASREIPVEDVEPYRYFPEREDGRLVGTEDLVEVEPDRLAEPSTLRRRADHARQILRKETRVRERIGRRLGTAPEKPDDPLGEKVWALWVAGDCHIDFEQDDGYLLGDWDDDRRFDQSTIDRRTTARAELQELAGNEGVWLERDGFAWTLRNIRTAEADRARLEDRAQKLGRPSCECDGSAGWHAVPAIC